MSELIKRSPYATELLAAIVDSSDDAIVSKNLDGIITSWNFGAEQIFGCTESEVIGKSITIIIPPDRQSEEPDILAHIRRGERIHHFETVRQKKDGTLIDVSLTISPVIGPDGRIVGASKIARDISARKAAEKARDLLFREMRHRVRNTLALAASICRQTFHSATEEEYSHFFSRIQALAAAHELLSRESWEGASMKDVVAKAMEPHRTGQGRIHIAGPDIAIGSGKAVSIALALHELATNAAKYGALSGASGTVHIEWTLVREEADTIRFHWQERGGPEVVGPGRKGFGSRLIERGLAAEFRSIALDFQPEGVVCAFEFFPQDAQDGA
ncbi:sensor histidine kinase [Aquamicrobium soli]|uniref:Blue-light-activated histidine kinase n=1 Tax=Aquamicrobium soli TaxID=1811518 RepID=A0ABV7KBW9_9HYPH